MEYMRILFTNIAMVHSFIPVIYPAFMVCHDFASIGDVDQASMSSNVTSSAKEVAIYMKSSLIKKAPQHGPDEAFPFVGVDGAVSRLQLKHDFFEGTYYRGVACYSHTGRRSVFHRLTRHL